jgi:hypothetical protein
MIDHYFLDYAKPFRLKIWNSIYENVLEAHSTNCGIFVVVAHFNLLDSPLLWVYLLWFPDTCSERGPLEEKQNRVP